MRARVLALGLLALTEPLATRRARISAEATGRQLGRITVADSHHLEVEPYNNLSDVRDFDVASGDTPVFRGRTELHASALKPGDDVRIDYVEDAGQLRAIAIQSLGRADAWLARTLARSSPPAMLAAADPPGLPEAQVVPDSSTVGRGIIDKIGDGHLTLRTSGTVFQFDGTDVPVYEGSTPRTWRDLLPGCGIRIFTRGGSRHMPARVVAIELLRAP